MHYAHLKYGRANAATYLYSATALYSDKSILKFSLWLVVGFKVRKDRERWATAWAHDRPQWWVKPMGWKKRGVFGVLCTESSKQQRGKSAPI